MRRPGALGRVLALVAGAGLLASAAGCQLGGSPEQKTLTAHFARTVGLYPHSDVRLLGVRIGEVTRIKPEGTSVRVDMTYDAKYKLPIDARAVVIAPSIVSDRYVQVTPVWRSGPDLPSGEDLAMDRTAVPVELDQIYAALDQLNRSLGPEGANQDGSFSRLLHTGARNLKGNGELLNSTLLNLSQAVSTLSDQRSDLFATIDNLQDFSTTLAQSDETVRRFNTDLADVAAQLSGERQDLATAIRELSLALGEVATFVRENKTNLTANVKDLASVTSVLVRQKRSLEEFLDNSATALSNLQLAYNPRSGTLDTRDNNNKETTPEGLLCNLLTSAGLPAPTCPAAGPAPAPVPDTSYDATLGGILEARR